MTDFPHRAAARSRHSLLWMWARGACWENRGSTERSSHDRVIRFRTSRAQQLNWIGVCKEDLPRCQHVWTVLFVSGECCIDLYGKKKHNRLLSSTVNRAEHSGSPV